MKGDPDPWEQPKGKFYWRGADGVVRFALHAGQQRAMKSKARFVAVIAGTQSGKTESGPAWLWKEIKSRGPGDYLVATPTYPLLSMKALPVFLKLFRETLGLGEYSWQKKIFTFSKEGAYKTFGYIPDEPTQVFFGHAMDPDSLESATAKAAWLDEAGQKKFKMGSWEAIQRRLSVHEGRAFITTTPYDIGWLKKQIFDRWKSGDKDYEVINFRSTMNPAFPKKEYERAKRTLPRWKFDLFYNGIFTRPAGAIYDCYDEAIHTCPRFELPKQWKRFLGLDFGGVNTAGVFFAKDPNSGIYYAYREYNKYEFQGTITCKRHAENLLKDEPMVPFCVGGAKSENQWRIEMANGGLPVREPDQPLVDIGITRVYGAIKEGKVMFFDDLDYLLEEMTTYTRALDENNEPTEKIEDKETFHHLDAVRYILGWEFRNILTWTDVDTGAGEELDESLVTSMGARPEGLNTIRNVCS